MGPECTQVSLCQGRLARCHRRNTTLKKIQRSLTVQAQTDPSPPGILTRRLEAALTWLETEEEKDEKIEEMQKRQMGIREVMKLKDPELPHVVIVGRPNVGKSALLNRLTDSSRAIVHDKPGVTRDRLFVRAFWVRSEFMLIDTGGLPDTKVVSGSEPLDRPLASDAEIPVGIEKQVAAAVDESDVIIFVTDGKDGPVDGDHEILSWLRKQHATKPVLLAVNKCENAHSADYRAALFWELGLEPHPVSAISGLGTGDLLDALVSMLPTIRRKEEIAELTSVAIIGRPNTGKSSLLNAFVGKERAIVSRVPGTTRDAIDCQATLFNGERIKLVDTAGIRRRTAVYGSDEKVEPMMVNRALRALQQCNIAVLMVDCYEGIRQHDAHIVEMAKAEGCGLVIAANKFDLLDQNSWDKPTVKAIVKQQLSQYDWALVVVTSLKEQHSLKPISKAILEADANHGRRLSTSTINAIVQDAVHFRPPPASKTGKKGRIYYASQVATRPPTFVLFVNDDSLFDDAYQKYIEKHLRQNIALEGTSVKIIFRGKPPQETNKHTPGRGPAHLV